MDPSTECPFAWAICFWLLSLFSTAGCPSETSSICRLQITRESDPPFGLNKKQTQRELKCSPVPGMLWRGVFQLTRQTLLGENDPATSGVLLMGPILQGAVLPLEEDTQQLVRSGPGYLACGLSAPWAFLSVS
ncbi:lysyl oxidase-like protein 1 [Platysternon megacephalum]|uniref:Lysyl oxidase-like protein 1 n=1 Tax=Platysternon megacephalum TaxID=55544 RepID=A0A4D9E9P6_9SAUR|nr:lysyl oxidase-like protein 1 [Platysternon megacephalum]